MSQLRVTLIIMIIVTIAAATAPTTSTITGPREYQGTVTYIYTQGQTPIQQVTFTFQQPIADKLLIVATPTGWTPTTTGNTLTLAGGTLNPGDQLTFLVSAWKPIPPGDYPFTSQGGTTSAQGTLQVKDMTLTRAIWTLYDNLIIVVALTILLAAAEIYLTYKKKPAQQTPTEPQPPDTP